MITTDEIINSFVKEKFGYEFGYQTDPEAYQEFLSERKDRLVTELLVFISRQQGWIDV